jgi:hypothetical protein
MKTKTIKAKTLSCEHCGRKIEIFCDPEPDDEIICLRCDESREESRRDLAWEAQAEEREYDREYDRF